MRFASLIAEKLSFGATNEDDVLLALCTTTSVLGLDIARTSDLSSHPLTLFFTSLLAKFRCNNFGITSSLQSVVGAGVFEHGAILNHSCSPNCILHYEREAISDQVRQTIVVIRDVKEVRTDGGNEGSGSISDIFSSLRSSLLATLILFSIHFSHCRARSFVTHTVNSHSPLRSVKSTSSTLTVLIAAAPDARILI